MAKYDFHRIVDSIYAGVPVKRILEKHAYDPMLIIGIDQEMDRRKRAGERKVKDPRKVVKEEPMWEKCEDGSMRFLGIKRS